MAKEPKTVDMRTRIKVKVTDKNPHAKTGDILEVHPTVATKGYQMGHYEPVKEDKK